MGARMKCHEREVAAPITSTPSSVLIRRDSQDGAWGNRMTARKKKGYCNIKNKSGKVGNGTPWWKITWSYIDQRVRATAYESRAALHIHQDRAAGWWMRLSRRLTSTTMRSWWMWRDRKSTRLNSSHQIISYAVFCLKKKKQGYKPKTAHI